MSEKRYGLILPKSKAQAGKPATLTRNSAFADESSDEDDETKAVASGSTDWMKKKLAAGGPSVNSKSGATGLGSGVKKQTQLALAKAMEEDPTVFQYDEVYDRMEEAKADKVSAKKDADRKPKYIASLLKQADIRNRENERRIERKVQKERDAEGDEFADKEKFVTSAYRKKMEEMQKLDEEDRRRDEMEKVLDVRKQSDLSGFYRHIYRQTMGEEKGQHVPENPGQEESAVAGRNPEPDAKFSRKNAAGKQRSYRQRDEENSGDDDDADTDLSSSSEESGDGGEELDDGEEKAAKERARREEMRRQKEKRDRRKRRIEEGRDSSSEEDDENPGRPAGNGEKVAIDKENVAPARPKVTKAKKDIWKKVTVGEAFDAALKRYLVRKSSRTSFP